MDIKKKNALFNKIHILAYSVLGVVLFLAAAAAVWVRLLPEKTPDLPASPEVLFDLPAGAYPEPNRRLTLTSPSGLPIYYTTDGSIPDENAILYEEPVVLDAENASTKIEEASDRMYVSDDIMHPNDGTLPFAVIIRAAVRLPDGSFGPVISNTYFPGLDIPEKYGCPVLSLITDPEGLLDEKTGILVRGEIFKQHEAENKKMIEENQLQNIVANYTQHGKEWEREAFLQIFDNDNALSAESPCGIRVRGGYSRCLGQRSFTVFFREEYGQSKLRYPLLPGNKAEDGKEIRTYKSFMLRNGGNDTEHMKFKDAVLQKLLSGYAFSVQTSRPAILFLNGEYYGIFNMGEKYSEEYLSAHYGVGRKNVIMVENGEIDEGTEEDLLLYQELKALSDADLTDPDEWDSFCKVADPVSLAHYFAAEIYIGNADFSEDHNYRLWRSRAKDGTAFGDGRWRWMLYDTEFSSGLYKLDMTAASYDHLRLAEDNFPFFASAMRNEEFRTLFEETIAEMESRTLAPETVSAALDENFEEWEKYYADYYLRFGSRISECLDNMLEVKQYFEERPAYMQKFLT